MTRCPFGLHDDSSRRHPAETPRTPLDQTTRRAFLFSAASSLPHFACSYSSRTTAADRFAPWSRRAPRTHARWFPATAARNGVISLRAADVVGRGAKHRWFEPSAPCVPFCCHTLESSRQQAGTISKKDGCAASGRGENAQQHRQAHLGFRVDVLENPYRSDARLRHRKLLQRRETAFLCRGVQSTAGDGIDGRLQQRGRAPAES